jgi:hypothetical protein
MIPQHKEGSLAELKAAAYMVEKGYDVFFPITMNPKSDFIMSKGKEVIKVQVKKASWSITGRFKYLQVRIIGKQKGDYQRVYRLEDFDLLLVLDGNRIWEIPAAEVLGMTSLCLGSTNPNPRTVAKSRKQYDPDKWLHYLN